MSGISVDKLRDTAVYDSKGAKLGKVGQIFLDAETEAPNFFTVKNGSRGQESVIPVAFARLDGSKVRVLFDEDFIKGAPTVDADEGLEPSDQDEIAKYYDSGDAADDLDAGAEADEDHDVVVEEEGTMIRRAERLTVGTETEEVGQARLRKRVVTKTETVEVPLEREELVIERESLSDEEAQEGGDLTEEEEVIVLREERAVVDKEVVGVEKVTLGKRIVADTETISQKVQEEQIDIDEGTKDDNRR